METKEELVGGLEAADELQVGFWQRWRRRILVGAIMVAVVGGLVAFGVQRRGGEEMVEEEALVVPQVTVVSLGELAEGGVIEKIAMIEPATSAPLVARTGGRVTAVNAQLGSNIDVGAVVVEIDGAGEANPARAQLASARSALSAFGAIEREAMASADLAVATAQLSAEAARAGKTLTGQQVSKSREQADLAVRQAELALQDVQEGEGKTDALERSATIALETAELAQDQATIARTVAGRQTSDALKQAEQGLQTARQAKDRLAADLASQRVSIAGQLAAARAQVALADVTSPIAGQVTRLAVRPGDFVTPGQEIGEVTAFEGAQVRLDVITGVRNKLSLGQSVNLRVAGQSFTGEVIRLADGPSAQTALWQVDIFVDSTSEVVHPGDLVTVELPVGAPQAGTAFIPLDAVTVRQDGVILFTVGADDVVSEHVVSVTGFTSDFVEGVVDLPLEANVVVEGNRLLRIGDQVTTR